MSASSSSLTWEVTKTGGWLSRMDRGDTSLPTTLAGCLMHEHKSTEPARTPEAPWHSFSTVQYSRVQGVAQKCWIFAFRG